MNLPIESVSGENVMAKVPLVKIKIWVVFGAFEKPQLRVSKPIAHGYHIVVNVGFSVDFIAGVG